VLFWFFVRFSLFRRIDSVEAVRSSPILMDLFSAIKARVVQRPQGGDINPVTSLLSAVAQGIQVGMQKNIVVDTTYVVDEQPPTHVRSSIRTV
jgi:hypothetical protein